MAVEIERKFLVVGDEWREAPSTFYCQGYLNRDRKRTVRVRVAGDQAFLTIKGPTVGASRSEFEYAIPVADAKEMFPLCEQPLIEKNRHIIKHGGLTWEVDDFLGANAGLVVAEVELECESQQVSLPDWIGEEVTGDSRYYNSRLSQQPYSSWASE